MPFFVFEYGELLVEYLYRLGAVDLRRADAVEPFHRDYRGEVLAPVFGVDAVDSDGHFAAAEFALLEVSRHKDARGVLFGHRDGVFKVEYHASEPKSQPRVSMFGLLPGR